MTRDALIARLHYYACEDAEQGDVLTDAIAMLQRDGETIAALEAERDALGGVHTCSPGCEKTALCRMTNERDRLREVASNAAHQLEQARIWNGSGWHWNPLHATVALHAWEILQEVLRKGGTNGAA